MKALSDQKKGSLLALIAVMFITPDSLFIRLSNVILGVWFSIVELSPSSLF